jgi:hypothetical protein
MAQNEIRTHLKNFDGPWLNPVCLTSSNLLGSLFEHRLSAQVDFGPCGERNSPLFDYPHFNTGHRETVR